MKRCLMICCVLAYSLAGCASCADLDFDAPHGADNASAFETSPNYPTDALREGMIGAVHHVVDGDTLELAVRGRYFKIRFKGASAPECLKDTVMLDGIPRYRCVADDEYYGLESYRQLLDIIGDSRLQVVCESVGDGAPCAKDHYGRWLANLVRPDGVDIGEELLRRGAGFTSTSFRSQTRKAYCRAEYAARRAGRGMWKGKTVQQTLSKMRRSTQHWYAIHDRRCDEALGAL